MPEVTELLSEFHYSVDVWYNHLTEHQQREIDEIDLAEINYRDCTVFCKGEKQQLGSEPPKNRCISALNSHHKLVMGPVVYALEQYFKKFKGYCGGANWTDMAEIYDDWYEKDYQIIQCDVSGMDRSVTMELKEIIFHTIYDHVAPHIHHVEPETWKVHSTPRMTKMISNMYSEGKLNRYGTASILGTVFSGSCDTTFMNTVTTVVLNRFVAETKLSCVNYDLKCKGDDSVVGLPRTYDKQTIVKAYATTYYFANQIKSEYAMFYGRHGSGLCLKYLQISNDTSDIDFCSTNVFRCKQCKKHRVTRRLDRFVELTPWSSAIVHLPYRLKLAYKQALHDSNLKWMRGLPIYTQLNDTLCTNVYDYYSLAGKTRRKRVLSTEDRIWQERFFSKIDDQTYQLFGKQDYYSMINQTGDIQPCCSEYYFEWLFEKCGLSRLEVSAICKQIADNQNDILYSPLLSDALSHYSDYKKSTYFSL